MADLPGTGRVTKRFRVAREGQTVDGRMLTRVEILDMAATYDPAVYGGRINIEHIAGYSPQPPFNAYGDILLVEAELEGGLMSLYNTISALPNFLEINKQGQKIYPSIEFVRDFAGTGRAYQVGLGMTDNPASLGTEAIKFSQLGHPILRTAPSSEIFYMQNNAQPNATQGFLSRITAFLSKQPGAVLPAAPAQPKDLLSATAEAVVHLGQALAEMQSNHSLMLQALSALVPDTQATTSAQPTNALHAQLLTNITQFTGQATQPAGTAQLPAADRFANLENSVNQLVQLLSSQPANPAAPTITGAGTGINLF